MAVSNPNLFETSNQLRLRQPKLFGLEKVLGDGWLKALRLEEYASRNPRQPQALQQALLTPAGACQRVVPRFGQTLQENASA